MTAFALVAILAALPVFGSTPEQDWKAAIADQNKDYAQTPHAMLKIQDAAYLGEGQTAALAGRKGIPPVGAGTRMPGPGLSASH